jgi:hypothetical protein
MMQFQSKGININNVNNFILKCAMAVGSALRVRNPNEFKKEEKFPTTLMKIGTFFRLMKKNVSSYPSTETLQ